VQANAGFEFFPHDADIGIVGRGRTVETAFAQAARALTALVTDAAVEERQSVAIACAAADRELLLVAWLNAVIFEMATRCMLFHRFAVRISDGRLEGEAWGEPLDVARHAPACEPKGATCTLLKVARQADGLWRARCVIDL